MDIELIDKLKKIGVKQTICSKLTLNEINQLNPISFKFKYQCSVLF